MTSAISTTHNSLVFDVGFRRLFMLRILSDAVAAGHKAALIFMNLWSASARIDLGSVGLFLMNSLRSFQSSSYIHFAIIRHGLKVSQIMIGNADGMSPCFHGPTPAYVGHFAPELMRRCVGECRQRTSKARRKNCKIELTDSTYSLF